MSDNFWGREQDVKDAHFFKVNDAGQGNPVCDVEYLVEKVKKTSAKPLCPECVEIAGKPTK